MLQEPGATLALFHFRVSSRDLATESSALSNGAQDSPGCSKAPADRSQECGRLASPEPVNTAKETAIAEMRKHATPRKLPFAFRRSGAGESERREKVCSRSASNEPDNETVWFLYGRATRCEKSPAWSGIPAAAWAALRYSVHPY